MASRRRVLKVLAGSRRQLRKWWWSNSGDWRWLTSKPIPVAGLNRLLWRESVPSLSFVVMLTLSSVISTLGLLAGSTATVIGAMIIAPLMGPIIGVAYAIAVANRRLIKRAGLTLVFGTLVAVVSATVICYMTGLRTLTEEIILRTEPTLIDLAVAMAAGAAGAFAKSRKHVADSFPGVAIAVALVPPLSVVGIGIALGNETVWMGATLLYITNLTGIIFSGILIFLWQEYGSLQRAKEGIIASVVMIVLLGVPLGLSLQNLLVQSNLRQRVRYLVRNELPLLDQSDIQAIAVQEQTTGLLISLEVLTPNAPLSPVDLEASQRFLESALQRPVTLSVRVIPVQEFTLPASP
ncbi:MAG: DUF389 domain-containing protein [Cyanobacteria bacterium]|nr:DUF389 domain-containing protein [Cyanobacteriota bacterium]